MGRLTALAESNKPNPERILWLINKARAALGLRSLSEIPKGVVPTLDEYLPSAWGDEGWEEFDGQAYDEVLARLPVGGIHDLGDAGVRIGWLDAVRPSPVWSPLGISLHCEPRMGLPSEFQFLCVRKAAGKYLAKALGTRLLPPMYDAHSDDNAFVLLPQELNQFIECYSAGQYPELTNPSPVELHLYELQSELDMRDFADKFRLGMFWPVAGGTVLILVALWFVRLLLR